MLLKVGKVVQRPHYVVQRDSGVYVVSVYVCICVCMYMCVLVCVYVCICVYMYVYVCISVCMYVVQRDSGVYVVSPQFPFPNSQVPISKSYTPYS
jgi:hypothetical protein